MTHAADQEQQPRDERASGFRPDDVARGLIYTHNRANANTAEVHETRALVEAVAELLVERGLLEREQLDERRDAAAGELRRRFVERGMAVALQEFGVSKYRFPGAPEIDCENRLHLCKAACCKLPVALSKEDVEEGALRWDLAHPYLLAQGEDGYCVHLDRETRRCSAYEHRPIPCRGYDCRHDDRIWVDFERRIPNPSLDDLNAWTSPAEEEDR